MSQKERLRRSINPPCRLREWIKGQLKECAHGLRDAGAAEGAANFEEFLLKRFGSGIAEHFLLPYNRKLGHPVDTEIQRIYAAEPRLPAHKIVINHNSSPYLRSLPHHGITGEVSYSAEKELAPDIEERFLKSLVELKIIKDVKEALKTVCVDVRYAYPVPTPDRDNIIARLKHWLCEREIYTVGRFGEWTYINSDEAIYRGLNLGRSLNGSRWSAHA